MDDDNSNSIKKTEEIDDDSPDWGSVAPELWTEIFLIVPPRFIPLFKFMSENIHLAIYHHNFALHHFPHHNTTLCCKEEHGYDDPLLEPITRIIIFNPPTNDGVLLGWTMSYVNRPKTPNFPLRVSRRFNLPVTLRTSYKCEVVGNVNGLLLIHIFECLSDKWSPRSDLIIWNCLTGRYFEIPKSPYSKITWWAQQVEVGFVYDLANDDYKILVFVVKPELTTSLFFNNVTKNHALVEIFSLRTNSWNNAKTFEIDVNMCLGPKVCLNEEIHWLAGTVVDALHIGIREIYSVNLGTESHRCLDLPHNEGYHVLTVHEGSLSIINVYSMTYSSISGIVEVWKFNRDTGRWVYETGYGYPYCNLYLTLAYGPGVQSALYMVTEDLEYLLFNLLDGRFIKFLLGSNDLSFLGGNLIYMDPFVESLLSPSHPFQRTSEDGEAATN